MGKSKVRSGGQRPRPANQRNAAKPHRRKLVWLGTLGTAGVAVLVGVLVNVLSTQAQRAITPAPPSSNAPELEVDGVSLTSASVQDSSSNTILTNTPYKIDLKLLNTGNSVAVINDARLIIQQFAVLSTCGLGGFFGSSHTYGSDIPANPRPGQVVNIPLSQEIPPNGADRFDLLLTVPQPKNGADSFTDLYRIHLYLTYNVNTKPLDVGEVLVDLPAAPEAGNDYWDSYYSTHPQAVSVIAGPPGRPEYKDYKTCAVDNSYTLRSILSLPSMRPAQLATILPQLRY